MQPTDLCPLRGMEQLLLLGYHPYRAEGVGGAGVLKQVPHLQIVAQMACHLPQPYHCPLREVPGQLLDEAKGAELHPYMIPEAGLETNAKPYTWVDLAMVHE